MALPIYRLRRWLVVIAVLFTAVIAGMYVYARMRVRNVLKEIPNKIGIDIKQTAAGFQLLAGDRIDIAFTIGQNDHPDFGGLELTLRDFKIPQPAVRSASPNETEGVKEVS